VGNESVPIQLAQCWFPGLASSNAKIYYRFILSYSIRNNLAQCWFDGLATSNAKV